MAKPSLFNRKRPPRFVMVAGHRIKIKVVKHLVDDADDDLHGAYNGDTKTIYLAKDSDWKSTLWHEILHCALHLSAASEGLTTTKEEQIVSALEYATGPLLFKSLT